jgi:hypothetical protein
MNNPDTMTLTEMRDWHVKENGWHYEPNDLGYMSSQTEPAWWKYTISKEHGGRTWSKTHPFPATLDGADSAMPNGYRAERKWCDIMHRWEWAAWKPNPDPTGRPWTVVHDSYGVPVYIADTGDEITDRYRLGMKAKLAEKETKHGT